MKWIDIWCVVMLSGWAFGLYLMDDDQWAPAVEDVPEALVCE